MSLRFSLLHVLLSEDQEAGPFSDPVSHSEESVSALVTLRSMIYNKDLHVPLEFIASG